MIRTYKNFKKQGELFLGLGLWTWLQLALPTALLVWFGFSLKLSLDSPLLLVLAILWMIVLALIIKASLDDEVPGFYSSFLLHPFANHVFRLEPNNDGYASLQEMQNIYSLENDYFITKEADLLAVIKLKHGISWNKLSHEDKGIILDDWAAYLGQIQSIDALGSYLLNANALEDSVQALVWLKPYTLKVADKPCVNGNLALASRLNRNWMQENFVAKKFIASPEFYLIIRHKNHQNKNKFLTKLLTNLFPSFLLKKFLQVDFSKIESEITLLEQKIKTCTSMLARQGLDYEQVRGKKLQEFYNNWLYSQDQQDGEILEDCAKYLKFKNRLHKVYRLTVPPASGEINFWLLNYFNLIKAESYISIQFQPRNAVSDRRRAEAKTEILTQLKSRSKVSTVNIIQENQDLARDLIDKPFSFDLVIYLGVIADSLEELQAIDTLLRKPIKQSKLDPLDRQQVSNWLYSLPFAYNRLRSSEKLFANLDFARACFPFVDFDLGTNTGPLMGSSLYNSMPVFLDEYDRSYCNNRAINFIGDSGSGKTVAAKLAVKRRLADCRNKFFIIDNTEDGWKFFVNYFAGEIIEIDNYAAGDGMALFNPLKLLPLCSDAWTKQVEDFLNLLALMAESNLNANERVIWIDLLKQAYAEHSRPCLSDLYRLLESTDIAFKWLAILAPYCAGGIYSKLMDGRESYLDADKQLRLFTFAKLNHDANFLPVSLFLLTNFIEHKICVEKEVGITLVVDEAWKIFTGKHSERGKELLTHLARAGRGLDLGLWTISQKPSDIPREIHSSASVSLCFQLKEARDRAEMAAAANLNVNEQELLQSSLIYESGNALFKTTRASGLIKMQLDAYEAVLCNSTRDFVRERDSLLQHYLQDFDLETASLRTVEELSCKF